MKYIVNNFERWSSTELKVVVYRVLWIKITHKIKGGID